MKTAISVDAALLEDVDHAARDLGVSRSKLFATAAEDFLRQRRHKKTLEQLNQAYDGTTDPVTAKIKASTRRILRDRW